MNKNIFSLLVFCFIKVSCFSQQNLNIALNKNELNAGDTLHVTCISENNLNNAATLEAWIDDLSTGKRWKYRYPLLKGKCDFSIIVSQSIKPGNYAINIFINNNFFSLFGNIKNYNTADTSISLMLQTDASETYMVPLNISENGDFVTGKLVFENGANAYFFSSAKSANIQASLKSYIDSPFVPEKVYTYKLAVKNNIVAKSDTGTAYVFNLTNKNNKDFLPEVFVKSIAQKRIEKFDKEKTNSQFRVQGKLIDGYQNEELEASPDVFQYLMHINTGLNIIPYRKYYQVTRYVEPVNIFIDEIEYPYYDVPFVSVADVAMIKIFEPYTGPSTKGGGALAIYTKSFYGIPAPNTKNGIKVYGYTPQITNWQ